MSARVLVIGLDAAEATLIERWAQEGQLPNFARLMQEGASVRLKNCLETLPGAIWPEIWSGRSSGKIGHYFHPEHLHTGEVALRRINYDEVDPADNYWTPASRAGLRVCIVDQPMSVLDKGLNGIQVIQWALHDQTFSHECHPPELKTEIKERFGKYPMRPCDRYKDSIGGRQNFLDDLIEGAEKKKSLLIDLMKRQKWNLFSCVLSESHCVGHHFWHFLDPDSPENMRNVPDEHRGAIQRIYQIQDQTIGELVRNAGSKVTTIIVASHGMGPARAGYQMLPEILSRLGMGSDRGSAKRGALREIQSRIKNNVPVSLLPSLRALVKLGPIKAFQRRAGALRFPLESEATRAIAVPNNRVGAIRLNLKGREPFGSVAPGNEAGALIDEIRSELLKLIDPKTHKTIIERVMTPLEVFGPGHHPDLPDMMIVFRGGREPIEVCFSDRVGTIHVPYSSHRNHRSGDHTVESRLWAMGEGIPSGEQLPDANTLDIAPTILQLLGVPLPGNFDGQPISLCVRVPTER